MAFSLAVVGFYSCLFSLLFTPAFRDLARRLGWLDAPDRKRKIHFISVPSAGGVPVFLACAMGVAAPLFLPLPAAQSARDALPAVVNILSASFIVLAVGLVDDIFGLTPWRKLLGQSAAAAIACSTGIQIHSIAGYAVPAWLSFPVVLVWLLVCTNAFNLIDGVDGLAPGIGLLAAVTACLAGLLRGDFALALVAAALAGALLGFLPFNFSPASLFLGDTGSLWTGFVLGCCAVRWSADSDTLLGVTAPVMVLAVPLADTTLAIARRFLRCQPIFTPDRGHIHHRLLDLGFAPRQAVLVLYGASALAAVFAALQTLVHGEARGFVLVLFFAAAWLGIRQLGYDEFRVAARLASLTNFRELLSAQLRLRKLEESVAAARTVEDCWCPVRDAAREFGFSSIALSLAGSLYVESVGNGHGNHSTLKVHLSDSDYVALTFHGPATAAVAPFADILYRALHDKPSRIGPKTAPDADPSSGVSTSDGGGEHFGRVG